MPFIQLEHSLDLSLPKVGPASVYIRDSRDNLLAGLVLEDLGDECFTLDFVLYDGQVLTVQAFLGGKVEHKAVFNDRQVVSLQVEWPAARIRKALP